MIDDEMKRALKAWAAGEGPRPRGKPRRAARQEPEPSPGKKAKVIIPKGIGGRKDTSQRRKRPPPAEIRSDGSAAGTSQSPGSQSTSAPMGRSRGVAAQSRTRTSPRPRAQWPSVRESHIGAPVFGGVEIAVRGGLQYITGSGQQIIDVAPGRNWGHDVAPPRQVPNAARPAREWRTAIGGVTARALERPDWFRRLLTTDPDEVGLDRRFAIGIDAGTSGIRVAAFDEYHEETRLFDFGRNQAGGTRFSFPTVAAVDGEHLLLGNGAVQAPAARRFESVKASLVHAWRDDEICERWRSTSFGGLAELTGSRWPTASDFLYAVMVARALELSLPGLVNPHGTPSPAYFTLSIGAPLNHDEERRRRFARGLACAVELAGGIGERPQVGDLLEGYAAAWARVVAHQRHDEFERLFVRSEAQSALNSLRPLFKPWRNFLVADVGATTTDLAVVRIAQVGSSCFSEASIGKGIDDLDRAESTGTHRDIDLVNARRVRASNPPVARWNSWRAKTEMGVYQKFVCEEQAQVYKKAILRDPDRRAWEEFFVVVVGGGSNVATVRQWFTAGTQPHEYVARRQFQPVLLRNVRVFGDSSAEPHPHEQYELPCVLGCAIPEWEVDVFRTPDQVPGRVPPRQRSRNVSLSYEQWRE